MKEFFGLFQKDWNLTENCDVSYDIDILLMFFSEIYTEF